jgi:hypothetical protein
LGIVKALVPLLNSPDERIQKYVVHALGLMSEKK